MGLECGQRLGEALAELQLRKVGIARQRQHLGECCGLGAALELELAERADQHLVEAGEHAVGGQDVGAEVLVEALEPGRGIRRIAEDAVGHAAAAAGVADDRNGRPAGRSAG